MKSIQGLTFIPNTDQIIDTFDQGIYDLTIVCDCGDIKRVGDSLIKDFSESKKIINIDHHKSNTNFGHLNLVNEAASSTCEIIFDVLKSLNVELDKEIAVCLLTGIVGDTGFFRYRSTTQKTFAVTIELLKLGANTSDISDFLSGNRTVSSVLIHSNALLNMHFYHENKISLITVKKEDFLKYNATLEDSEGLAEPRARYCRSFSFDIY